MRRWGGMHILFNHESLLCPERFVTRKIVVSVRRIAAGSGEKLRLGNLEIERDWGGRRITQAMWRILQQGIPDDFVIATGKTSSLRGCLGGVLLRLVSTGRIMLSAIRRPAPHRHRDGAGHSAKALAQLGWQARFRMRDVVDGG